MLIIVGEKPGVSIENHPFYTKSFDLLKNKKIW